MLRRAGFVCRSCLLALSRPRLTPPPPPQLAHARKHTRSVSTLDDPFARLAEAQKNDLNLNNASLLPNDFSGTVPTPPPPDEPEPPPRGRKRWSISNSSKQPQPNPTRGEGKSGLRHRKLELERGDDAVDQGDEGAGDEGNGLIKPPSKNFKFRRIKRKPLYNQRQRMVNYLAGVGSMTSGEKAHLTRKFVKWRKEFITKVWPHTQPITTQEERAKLQLGDPPESVDFPIPPDVPSIREGWFKWVESKRRDRWPKLITTTMKFWPHRTHEVLEATFEEGVTPYYAVADVISFIVRWAIPGTKGNWSVDPRIQRWGAERKIARSALPHLLLHILESSTPGSQRFRQWTLYRIINLADADTAASLNQALGNHQHLLHPYTRFQIGERLAKDVRLKYMALEHLEEMVATNKADANSKYSHALATSILSFPDPDKGNELLAQMRTELSERILRLGLTPNIYHYTVMIRSLCANGDFKTAWQIYEMLTEHNIAPDLYLYSALLNGAKLTGKLELVDRVVAHLPTMAFGSRVIRNDLLGAVLTAAIMEARAKGYKPPRIIPAFPAMLAFYARFYKLEKLQRIIPINLDEIVANSEEYHEMRRANWRFIRLWEQFILPRVPKGDKLLDPSSDTLAIMILGFLKSNESKYQIMAFYSHFQMLLGQGDMVACELCRYNGSAIHDFVLKAALEWEGMLRVSLDILSDMLQGKASRDRFLEEWPAYIKKQEESGMGGERRGGVKDWPLPLARKLNLGLVPVYEESAVGTMDKYNLNPAPSVYSWSIILNGAMYHRQLEQGVRIMKLMREHGVEPNDVTWNTLIRGFARLQRTAATVTSMKRMEEHGYKADEFTMRAFGSLIDKEGALRMMDGMLEDMRREREQKGLDGGDSGLLREAIVSSDSIDDAGEGARPSSRDEVVEYDRILAAHQRQGGADDVEYIDWEKQAGEWENMNVEVDEEQEFVQRAKREVAEVVDNVDLSLPPVPPSPPPPPPPPPPPSLPPLMEDESELMDRPQSIPKPKIKYF